MAETRRRGTAKGRIAADWKAIADTPEGKRALAELFKSCGMYTEVPACDPMQAGLILGERNVCIRIAQWLGARPEEFAERAVDDEDTVVRIMDAYSNATGRR